MTLHLKLRGLMLADQMFFSAGNFILTISVARLFPEADFAALGVGLAFALAVQGTQKSLYIVPMSLMAPGLAVHYRGALIAEHLVFLGVTLLGVLAVIGATILFGGSEQVRLIGFATILCHLIYFQADFDRAIMLKLGFTAMPACLSLSYLSMIGVLAALGHFYGLPFGGFVGFMIGFSVAKGCVVVALVGVRPRWRNGWRLLGINLRRYGMPSIVGAASYAGFTQVPVMVLASVTGPAQIGSFVAMRSLMQPLLVVIRSLDAGDKNRFRELSGAKAEGISRLFWRTMATYLALGLLAFAALSIDPDRLVALVYHGKYAGHTELLFGWCIFAIFLALSLPIQSVVYLLGRQHSNMRWNMMASAVGFVIAIAACGPLGATGAMLSTLCGAGLMVAAGIWTVSDMVLPRRAAALATVTGKLGRERV